VAIAMVPFGITTPPEVRLITRHVAVPAPEEHDKASPAVAEIAGAAVILTELKSAEAKFNVH